MVMCCIVCKARAKAVDSRSFHRFPNSVFRRAAWIHALGIKKDPSKLFVSHVCSDHFESGDILLSEKLGKKYLRDGAIPNVNSHSKCSGNDLKEEPDIPEATLAIDHFRSNSFDECCLDLRSSESTITAPGTVCPSDEKEEKIEQTTTAQVLPVRSSMSLESNGKAKSFKKRKRPLRFIEDFSSSDMNDPHKARKCLMIAKRTLLRQAIQIKNLMWSQTRLRNRVHSLKSLLKVLNQSSKPHYLDQELI